MSDLLLSLRTLINQIILPLIVVSGGRRDPDLNVLYDRPIPLIPAMADWNRSRRCTLASRTLQEHKQHLFLTVRPQEMNKEAELKISTWSLFKHKLKTCHFPKKHEQNTKHIKIIKTAFEDKDLWSLRRHLLLRLDLHKTGRVRRRLCPSNATPF